MEEISIFFFLASCEGRPLDQYCNGYLKDISLFCVKVRAYTHDDYYDSPCSDRIETGND